MIELGRRGPKTGFNIPQAFAVSKLCEAHAQELIPTRKSAFSLPEIAIIFFHTAPKIPIRQKSDQLRKQHPASIHPSLWMVKGRLMPITVQIAARQNCANRLCLFGFAEEALP